MSQDASGPASGDPRGAAPRGGDDDDDPGRAEAADGSPPADFVRRTFNERERRAIRVLAAAVFHDGSGRDIDDRLDWLLPEVDRLVSATSPRVRIAYRVTLLLLTWTPLLVCLRFARLAGCSVEERVSFLGRLEHHPIGLFRLLLVPWKTALAFVYYEHPEALAETGYDDTCATGAPRRPGILGVVPRARLVAKRDPLGDAT